MFDCLFSTEFQILRNDAESGRRTQVFLKFETLLRKDNQTQNTRSGTQKRTHRNELTETMSHQLTFASEDREFGILRFGEMCTRVAPGIFHSENASNDPKESHQIGNIWKRKVHLQGESEKKCQGNGYLLWKENGEIYTLTGTPSNPVIEMWHIEDKGFRLKTRKKTQAIHMASRIARGGTLEDMRIDLISCIPQRPSPSGILIRVPEEVKDAQVKKLEKIKAKKEKDKREKQEMMEEIQKLRDELEKRDEKHRSERQEQELRHRGEMRKYEDNRRRELQEQEEKHLRELQEQEGKHRQELDEAKAKHQVHLEKINELLTEIDSSEEEEINVSSDEEEDEGTRQKQLDSLA